MKRASERAVITVGWRSGKRWPRDLALARSIAHVSHARPPQISIYVVEARALGPWVLQQPWYN